MTGMRIIEAQDGPIWSTLQLAICSLIEEMLNEVAVAVHMKKSAMKTALDAPLLKAFSYTLLERKWWFQSVDWKVCVDLHRKIVFLLR